MKAQPEDLEKSIRWIADNRGFKVQAGVRFNERYVCYKWIAILTWADFSFEIGGSISPHVLERPRGKLCILDRIDDDVKKAAGLVEAELGGGWEIASDAALRRPEPAPEPTPLERLEHQVGELTARLSDVRRSVARLKTDTSWPSWFGVIGRNQLG